MKSDFSKVSIIGGGQIGTSIAMALRKSNPNVEIVLVDKAAKTNAGDFYATFARNSIDINNVAYTDNMAGIAQSGLVILATPISEFGNVINEAAPYFSPDTVITDIGSVKEVSMQRILSAIDDMHDQLPNGIQYVPGHIFNGSAGSGPLTADPAMFDGKPMFLVPGIATQPVFNSVSKFFESLGSKIKPITAAKHDQVVGIMSHLQNGLMFALEQTDGFTYGVHKYSAPDIGEWIHGARGMTRVADAGPEMWSAIFSDNRDNLLESAKQFRKLLIETSEAVTPRTFVSKFLNLIKGSKAPTINEIVDNAHAYAKEIRGDRGGEPVDWTQYENNKQSLVSSAFAALLSIAVTRNLQRVEAETGIKLVEIANPSLKDGLMPIGVDPVSVKKLFNQYGPELQIMVRQQYLPQLDVLINAMKRNDTETTKAYVAAARKIRQNILSGETANQVAAFLEGDPHVAPIPAVDVVNAPVGELVPRGFVAIGPRSSYRHEYGL